MPFQTASYLCYARHHVLERNLDEASDWANATLKIFELCPKEYPMLRACQYATLSAVARERNQPTLACEAYGECFRINQEVYESNRVITSQLVAAYTELGRVMIMAGNIEEAEELIQESIRLRRQMPEFCRLQLYSPILYTSYIQLVRSEHEAAEKELLSALRDRELEYKTKDDTESKRYLFVKWHPINTD